MKLKKTIKVSASVIFILASFFLTYSLFFRHTSQLSDEVQNREDLHYNSDSGNTPNIESDDTSSLSEDTQIKLEKESIIAHLNELFSKGLYHPRVQLDAIETLIKYLKKLYPDNWESHVFEYLSIAFPEYAKQMYSNYKKLSAYKDWIKDNYSMLTNLPIDKLDELLMEKRKAFFGEEAQKIWELELKQKDVNNVLSEINDLNDIPFTEKTGYYHNQLKAIYGDISEP
jgi:hypothetical protein